MPLPRTRLARRPPAALLLALLSAALAPASLEGQGDPRQAPAGERMETLLERLREAQGALDSLRAGFEQRKESPLLLEPEVSRGTFYLLAPERVRWDYEEPSPVTVVLADRTLLTWYRDLGQAERLPLGRGGERMFQMLGSAHSVDRLTEAFRLSAAFPGDAAEPVRLDLEPRSARLKRRLESMQIWFAAETYLPVRIRYREAGGASTDIRFLDPEPGAEVPPELFSPELPPEVEVREIELGGP